MTAESKRPSAEAHIDELQAWAARANTGAGKTGPYDAGARGTGAPRATSPAAAGSTAFPATGYDLEPTGSGRRGGSLLPKVLLVVGAGVAAYLVFSFIIGLLMTLLMIAGGAALLYAVFRIGRWRGRGGG